MGRRAEITQKEGGIHCLLVVVVSTHIMWFEETYNFLGIGTMAHLLPLAFSFLHPLCPVTAHMPLSCLQMGANALQITSKTFRCDGEGETPCLRVRNRNRCNMRGLPTKSRRKCVLARRRGQDSHCCIDTK